MADKPHEVHPPSAPSLERVSKIWLSLPNGLQSATFAELQEMNEICCFSLEQVS